MQKSSWLATGRVETILACAILAAVIGLFARFYGGPRTPLSQDVPAPSDTTPVGQELRAPS